MNTRLQSFLNAENLTQSQFADSIGVARASISHILSGRNKPGFDFIENLARTYPSLNLEWLITGKGKMYDSPAVLADTPVKTVEVVEPSPKKEVDVLMDDNLFSEQNEPDEREEPDKYEEKEETDALKDQLVPQQMSAGRKKSISQIIIFFDDGTYSKVYEQ